MNYARELARSAVEDWDELVFSDAVLPCVFSNDYQESLDVEGRSLTAMVLRSDIEGNEKKVAITQGTTEVNVTTQAGESLGPFVIVDSREEMPFYELLVLRRA